MHKNTSFNVRAPHEISSRDILSLSPPPWPSCMNGLRRIEETRLKQPTAALPSLQAASRSTSAIMVQFVSRGGLKKGAGEPSSSFLPSLNLPSKVLGLSSLSRKSIALITIDRDSEAELLWCPKCMLIYGKMVPCGFFPESRWSRPGQTSRGPYSSRLFFVLAAVPVRST